MIVISTFPISVSGFEIRFSNSSEGLTSNWDDSSLINNNDIISGSLDPIEPGMEFEVQLNKSIFVEDLTYYFGVKAFDKIKQFGELSNNATLFIESEDTGLSGGALAGIVIGSVLGGFLLVLGGYMLYRNM